MLRTFGLAALFALAFPAASQATLLMLKPAAQVTQHEWLGVWLDGQNVVWVSRNPDDTLSVVGAAYSAGSEGHVTQGALDFEAAPVDGRITLTAATQAACGAELINLRTHLVVRDNGHCGTNVRFDGVYAHQ